MGHDPCAYVESLFASQRREGWLRLATGVILAILTTATLLLWLSMSNLQRTADTNADRINELRTLVQDACDPVNQNPSEKEKVAAQDPQAAEACRKAENDELPKPVPGPAGPQGRNGVDGQPGRSVTNAVCQSNGRWKVNYSDGTADNDAGPCLVQPSPGAAGKPGAQGPQGVPGVNGSDGSDDKDGSDGKDGRGIQSAKCDANGRWQITYTDGTTADGGKCLPL